MEKKLKSIKTLCPKPSLAVRAAITGITRLSKREDFQVEMSSYGSVTDISAPKPICVGCLATTTIMQIAKITPKRFIEAYLEGGVGHGISSSARKFNLDRNEIDIFENAINSLRYWDLEDLLKFYGGAYLMDTSFIDDLKSEGPIETENWQEQIPHLETLAVELEKQGL